MSATYQVVDPCRSPRLETDCSSGEMEANEGCRTPAGRPTALAGLSYGPKSRQRPKLNRCLLNRLAASWPTTTRRADLVKAIDRCGKRDFPIVIQPTTR